MRIQQSLIAALAVSAALGVPAPAAEPRAGYLVVSSRASLPLLEPLLELRRQHCEVSVLTVEELTRDGGGLTPARLKSAIRARNGERPLSHVLLVGDTRPGRDGLCAIPTHPQGFDTWYGVLATDDPKAQPAGLHQPTLAVGRFPASTARELAVMVGKTLAYETKSQPGPWQRRIHAVAGTANFGPVADALIDRAVLVVLDGAVPPAYSITVTRGLTSSPYCYPPDEFEGRVAQLFNEGALFVTYLGHGKAREAYRVRGFMTGTMMNCGTMQRLRCSEGRRPVAVFIACSMGRFDGQRDCVGESALKSPGGPVACVASARRNHVYGNAVFGLELTRALFDHRVPTLGGCVRQAHRRLVNPQGAPDLIRLAINALAAADPKARVPREKHEDLLVQHVYLYGLLGDPALRLARPSLSVEGLRATLAADRAGWLVEGRVAGMARGTALVTLETPRAVIPGRLEPVWPQDPRWREKMKRNYAAANHKVLAEVRGSVTGERFSVLLPAAPVRGHGAEGPWIVKVFATDGRASAASAVLARAPEERSKP